MSGIDAGNAPDGRFSAFGTMTRRRLKRLPTHGPREDRLTAERLDGVLYVLSDAAPTEASELLTGRIPLGPSVISPPHDEEAVTNAASVSPLGDAAEVIVAEVALGPLAPDTGRHRRHGVSAPDDSAREIPSELAQDAGRHRRHRRHGVPLPEDSAVLTAAQVVIAPVVNGPNFTAPVVLDNGRHRRRRHRQTSP